MKCAVCKKEIVEEDFGGVKVDVWMTPGPNGCLQRGKI